MLIEEVIDQAKSTLDLLRHANLLLVTAESCTGGLIAATLTEVAGSSDAFEGGFVTYSNRAKRELLGVSENYLKRHGAVSREVAIAMASGALRQSCGDVAVSVTGIAGPGGATKNKPIGLVHIAAQCVGNSPIHLECRYGDVGRREVRIATVRSALGLVRDVVLAKSKNKG